MLKTCREIMTENPAYCLPEDSPKKAAQFMKDEDIGSIPVVEDEGSRRLVGIITDRDLALEVVGEGFAPDSLTLDSIMTRGPFFCREGDDVQKALDLMADHQIRRIPIVDAADALVGIISQADVAVRM